MRTLRLLPPGGKRAHGRHRSARTEPGTDLSLHRWPAWRSRCCAKRFRCPNRQSREKDDAMGLFTKDIETMDDLFVHTLKDIYYAENQIVKALPDMIEKATDPKLKEGFKSHLAETRTHIKRVEQVFQMHGVEIEGVDCPAIDGIIEETTA